MQDLQIISNLVHAFSFIQPDTFAIQQLVKLLLQ